MSIQHLALSAAASDNYPIQTGWMLIGNYNTEGRIFASKER